MQFEMNHKVGTDYSTVNFEATVKFEATLKFDVFEILIHHFERLGGIMVGPKASNWTFPKHITSEVLQEVIRNTCFVCGGLMEDGVAIVDHKYVQTDAGKELWKNSKFAKQVSVRKCTVCGHSHT